MSGKTNSFSIPIKGAPGAVLIETSVPWTLRGLVVERAVAAYRVQSINFNISVVGGHSKLPEADTLLTYSKARNAGLLSDVSAVGLLRVFGNRACVRSEWLAAILHLNSQAHLIIEDKFCTCRR